MSDVYGFPLSQADVIRAETRHEAIDRAAEEAKAELRAMLAEATGKHMRWLDAAKMRDERQELERRYQNELVRGMENAISTGHAQMSECGYQAMRQNPFFSGLQFASEPTFQASAPVSS